MRNRNIFTYGFLAGIIALGGLLHGCGGNGINAEGFTPSKDDTPNYLSNLQSIHHYPISSTVTYGVTQNSNYSINVALVRAGADLLRNSIRPYNNLSYTTDSPDIQVEIVTPADINTFLNEHAIVPSGTVEGITYINTDSVTGLIIGSVVMINGNNYLNEINTAAHELTHALGCGGHSPYSTNLMYADAPLLPEPEPRDVNTLNYIVKTPYAANATSLPPESAPRSVETTLTAPSITIITGVDYVTPGATHVKVQGIN